MNQGGVSAIGFIQEKDQSTSPQTISEYLVLTSDIEQDGDGACSIAVADEGPGISAVDQRRIFERFFVTSDSVTRTGGGAGLGLYICHRLISAMDGDIVVDSSVGAGTTFRVSLPVIAASLPRERDFSGVSRPAARPPGESAGAPPAARYP